MTDAIRLTLESLTEYGRRYDHWCMAWSGGKDSTAALTLVVWLIVSGKGAGCGQGWFQQSADAATTDTLAPITHWRVCHVWEWLHAWAPQAEFGDWSTRTLAEAYGGRDGDEAQEIGARTGCVCCPLASR